MYKKLIVPDDMEHADKLQKSLETAENLASYYSTEVCYVGISTESPSAVAHNPKEFSKKLEGFAQQQSGKHGHRASAKAIASHDPSADMNDALLKAVDETGADLVVMASHGRTIASRAKVSVFLVR